MLHYIDNLLIYAFGCYGIFYLWTAFRLERTMNKENRQRESFGAPERLFTAAVLMLFAARAVYYMQQHTN